MSATIARPRRRSDYSLTGECGALAVQRGLVDAKWYASPIPRDKMRALLERRDGPALRDTLIWFALFVIFGAAGAALWGSWWAIIPFALYGVMYGTSSDSRWHECGHGRGDLANGFLQGTVIECPKHNGRVDLRDGSVRRPPPSTDLCLYPVCARDGNVQLKVTSGHRSGGA